MVISSPCLIDIKNWLVQSKRLLLTSPKQTALGKDISNPLIVDSLLKTIWLSMHHVIAMKHWLFQSKRLLLLLLVLLSAANEEYCQYIVSTASIVSVVSISLDLSRLATTLNRLERSIQTGIYNVYVWGRARSGGNKGIGLEICRQLALIGVEVVLTSRNESLGVEAIEKLNILGNSNVTFHQLDITDSSNIACLAKFVESNFKKL
ncbi:glucose/ribitol dehydrogenase [Tanacetum coccineum]|uniref:Glucose/ribitol dehydrogenase n=1 Tax=Tanacetum coccineum TaxID=301880 RepID=A0ABQ4WQK7_9ASTR